MNTFRALLLLTAVLLTSQAYGQDPPLPPPAGELTLSLSAKASGNQLIPSLIWTTAPVAHNCVATGDWTGTRAPTRTTPVVLPAASPPKVYQLSCSWLDPDVTVRWSPPTERTDGSTLTNLASYRIYYGTNISNLDKSVAINDPAVTERVIGPLTAGVWHFAMTATDAAGIESDRSPTVAKTTGSAMVMKSVRLELTKPTPPGGITVEDD